MTETLKKPRERLDFYDIVKAITILLVMVGHGPKNGVYPLFRTVLYSFHMPLFFMVSGVFVRRHQSSGYGWDHWRDFLRKNLLALIVPYLIWALIYMPFDYQMVPCIFYGSYQLLSKAGTLTSLWFLTALFTARVLMELILMSSQKLKKLDRHLYAALFAPVAFVISYLLPPSEIGYFFGFDCAFLGLGFMLLGYALKEWLQRMCEKKLWVHLLALLAATALFLAGFLMQGETPQVVKLYSNNPGKPVFFFLCAFSGIAIVLSLSAMLYRLFEAHRDSRFRRATLWIGGNTIGIYLLHKPMIQSVILPFLNAHFGLSSDHCLPCVLAAAISLPVCCLLILLINRYVPQLFGKFPDPRRMAVQASTEAAEQ